jgi:uncharacterized membrane protein
MNPIKIDTLFLAALLLSGTTLWTRVAVQGLEQALVSTAIEWFMRRIRPGARLLPRTISFAWRFGLIH